MIFYDFEVFRYDWLVVLIDLNARKETVIINDPDKLKRFYEEHKGVIWAGYNSRNYDQYILKAILCGFDPKPVNDWIIAEDKPGYRYSSLFREYPLINYDVMPNPPISLKALEAFMGHSIKETSVSFDIDRPLTEAELAETVKYCRHDVEQTVEVWLRRKEDEFDAQMSLVKAFHLPISDIGRTKAQLSAKILGAVQREHNDEFEIEFTVKFICDRGVSHEIVRHRLAAYCQESTRYCNYGKGKFGEEITVIETRLCWQENLQGSQRFEGR